MAQSRRNFIKGLTLGTVGLSATNILANVDSSAILSSSKKKR